MRLLLLALGLALVVACSNASDNQACDPGQQTECGCSGTTRGTQTCNADGTAYGACSCGTSGAGGQAGSDSGGAGAASTDPGPSCIEYGDSCDANIPCCSSMGCSIYNQCQP
jgi:hypothetical protein